LNLKPMTYCPDNNAKCLNAGTNAVRTCGAEIKQTVAKMF